MRWYSGLLSSARTADSHPWTAKAARPVTAKAAFSSARSIFWFSEAPATLLDTKSSVLVLETTTFLIDPVGLQTHDAVDQIDGRFRQLGLSFRGRPEICLLEFRAGLDSGHVPLSSSTICIAGGRKDLRNHGLRSFHAGTVCIPPTTFGIPLGVVDGLLFEIGNSILPFDLVIGEPLQIFRTLAEHGNGFGIQPVRIDVLEQCPTLHVSHESIGTARNRIPSAASA